MNKGKPVREKLVKAGSKNWALRAIGIAAFIYILSRINLGESLHMLRNMKLYYFLLAIPLFIPLIFLKSLRWKEIIVAQNLRGNLKGAFWAYLASFIWGMITPGRIGEFIKVSYLKEQANSFGKSLSSVLADRLSDAIFVLALGCWGLAYLFSPTSRQYSVVFLFLLGATIAGISLNSKAKGFLPSMVKKIIPGEYKDRVTMVVSDFLSGFSAIKSAVLIKVLFLTICSWILYFSQIYLFSRSLGIDLSFGYISIFSAISGTVSLLPISISGIGTRDIALIYLFARIGKSAEQAVALSLLVLLMNVINSSISAVAWQISPLRLTFKR